MMRSSSSKTINGRLASSAPGTRAIRAAALSLLLSVGAGPAQALDSVPAFEQTVYPLLRQYCVTCHAGSGPGFPSIASANVTTAHNAVVNNQKVNFMNPAGSRLVQRLATDRHFCWSNCAQDGVTMRMKIEEWAALVAGGAGGGGGGGGTPPPPPPGGGTPPPGPGGNPVSGLMTQPSTFAQGTIADSNRYEKYLIARYNFKEGSGTLVRDTSGIAPAMDLTLEGNGVSWLDPGIDITAGRAIATAAGSLKLHELIAGRKGRDQYSVEAWLIPAAKNQAGPARIVTYSNSTGTRNFMLGQDGTRYMYRNRNRSRTTDDNGSPNLLSPADEVGDTLQHVVITYHYHPRYGLRKIYVNGELVTGEDPARGGAVSDWDPSYRFILANELTNNRQWLGKILFVAIHNRVLKEAQVIQNYTAGVNDVFVLRFGLDPWLPAGNVIEFEASEYDAYSYLFCRPKLTGTRVNNLAVEGVRMMVNGVTPVMSQSFSRVATSAKVGVPVSELCAIVPKDQGKAVDSFRVHFDKLANNVEPTPEPPAAAPDEEDLEPRPDVGIRNFEQINDSMSVTTGVPKNTPQVEQTFDEIMQALPSSNDIRTFVSAHQTSISKLALEYCDALVNSGNLRQAFFGTQFEFTQPVPTAFSSQLKRDRVIDAVLDRMVGINLATQPDRMALEQELNQLIDGMIQGCNATTCPASRTQAVVKATCAAVLPSAAVLVE